MTRRRQPTQPPPALPDASAPELKERVLHTRVPESLETHLRERASELGVSVSNLVRNVLGHAFGLVGDVVADAHAISRAARGDVPVAPVAPPPVASALDDVLGWQPIIMGKNAVCAKCNAILPKGSNAAIGVGTQLVVCTACLEELRQ